MKKINIASLILDIILFIVNFIAVILIYSHTYELSIVYIILSAIWAFKGGFDLRDVIDDFQQQKWENLIKDI